MPVGSGRPGLLRRARWSLRAGWTSWLRLLRLAVSRFGEAEVPDRAATLAYYGFLSVFPALIVSVAVLALLGTEETLASITDALEDVAPAEVVSLVEAALDDALRERGAAGSLLGVGLIAALVGGSAGTAAAIRALEAIERRPGASGLVRVTLTRLWLTLALMALLLLAFTALLLAGPLFSSIAEAAGLGDEARFLVALLRWPVGLLALLAAFVLVYWRGPSGERRAPLSYAPGAALAAGLWVLASVGFSVYVGNFSSYEATYGALGTVIALLVWLYLGSMVFLLGGLVNAERLRTR